MAMAGGPPSAAGLARCLAYCWSPGLAASSLKQEGSAAEHWLELDSAGLRSVEAEPGHRLMMPGGGRRARKDSAVGPATISPGSLRHHD